MYPNKKSNYRIHGAINIRILDAKYPVFTPLRNPLDCIASNVAFMQYPNQKEVTEWIDNAANHYLNFYSYLKKYEDKTNILFFEKFTKDLSYIENSVKNIVFEEPKQITDEDVKIKMNEFDLWLSLPRNNEDQLKSHKKEIVKNDKYKMCVDIFEYFKDKYYNIY